MLTSTVLMLTPKALAEAPAVQGRAIHAWLLKRIEPVDPALSAQLHDGSTLRPFTLSDLIGTGVPHEGRVTLDPERPCTLRITTLTDEMAEALTRALPEPGEEISLAEADLTVRQVLTEAEQHPWAGRVTCGGLLQRQTLGGGRLPRSVTLRFASPTLFHSGGRDLPLPLPELVFGSYLQKWNRFSPISLPDETREYVERCVSLGRYELRTRWVSFEASDRGGHVGFVGEVSFRSRKPDPYWARLLQLLAAYSFWCGTGRRTSMGLGQTRLMLGRSRRRREGQQGTPAERQDCDDLGMGQIRGGSSQKGLSHIQ